LVDSLGSPNYPRVKEPRNCAQLTKARKNQRAVGPTKTKVIL
jgi:hypothetical protein